jgi:hypothetical protein
MRFTFTTPWAPARGKLSRQNPTKETRATTSIFPFITNVGAKKPALVVVAQRSVTDLSRHHFQRRRTADRHRWIRVASAIESTSLNGG